MVGNRLYIRARANVCVGMPGIPGSSGHTGSTGGTMLNPLGFWSKRTVGSILPLGWPSPSDPCLVGGNVRLKEPPSFSMKMDRTHDVNWVP